MKLFYIITVLLSSLAIGNSRIAGGRNVYDLNVPENLLKIEKLSTYGVVAIAQQRMKVAKNSVSSNSKKLLQYNHRVVSAESQIVAGKLHTYLQKEKSPYFIIV
jgi:hypothetical protein